MTNRREFLSGASALALAGALPRLAWADEGVRVEKRNGAWILRPEVREPCVFERFFYAHPEIAASGRPVLVVLPCEDERLRCWLRMYPDFHSVVTSQEEKLLIPSEPKPRLPTAPVLRPSAPGSIVFLQWNLGHFCHGRTFTSSVSAAESEKKAQAFRRFFDRYRPDVAGFCEYSRDFDEAKTPTRECVLCDFVAVDEGPQDHYQCNAVALRCGKLKRREIFHYPEHRQNTYYLADDVEIGGVRSVFVETHLDPKRSQVEDLIRRFADVPRVVLSADYNALDDSWYEPFLKAGYTAANCAAFVRFPTHREKKLRDIDEIDNVFVRGWTIEDVAVGDYEMALSDHRALVCALSPGVLT